MWFQLNITNLQGITNAQIHSGKQGENGPPLVQLYHSDTPTVIINDKLFSGTLYTDQGTFVGTMIDKQLFDLEMAMRDGETYVNVHTQQNPNGEVRGQIMISNSTFNNNIL
jgi:CHRD domain